MKSFVAKKTLKKTSSSRADMTFDEIKHSVGVEFYKNFDGESIYQVKEICDKISDPNGFLKDVREILETRDVLKYVSVDLYEEFKIERSEHLYNTYVAPYETEIDLHITKLVYDDYDVFPFLN